MESSFSKLVFTLAALGLLLSLSGCASKSSVTDELKASAKSIKLEKDQLKVTETILEFERSEALDSFLESSYGCAIFPVIGKGGMGIGGAHGKGSVFRKGDLEGESTMTQLTIGFQLGGQAFSQMIFFENKAAYESFISGTFEFGAQASAVVLTEGANAAATTGGGTSAGAGSKQSKSNYTSGMAVFTVAKGGLMYEASLGGQKFNYSPF